MLLSTASVKLEVCACRCNADGSWDSVWALSNYTSSGATYPQVYYCEALAQPWYNARLTVASTDMGAAGTGEHGSINATTFVVSTYFAQTSTCPLTSTAGATLLNTTEDTNSNLGALLQTPYCNSAIANSDLVHASALSAPAPGPDPVRTRLHSATPQQQHSPLYQLHSDAALLLLNQAWKFKMACTACGGSLTKFLMSQSGSGDGTSDYDSGGSRRLLSSKRA